MQTEWHFSEREQIDERVTDKQVGQKDQALSLSFQNCSTPDMVLKQLHKKGGQRAIEHTHPYYQNELALQLRK